MDPTPAWPAQLFDLTGKVACVTGASAGLGQHSARVLAAAGAKVVGVARRAEALADWQAEIGDKAAVVAADLSDRKSGQRRQKTFNPAAREVSY